jgi:ribosome-associated heat shock protein Hsp15
MSRGVDRSVNKAVGKNVKSGVENSDVENSGGENLSGETHRLLMRLDKWLVYARFCKTRSQAGALVADGKIRINGRKIDKPDTKLHINDVMTLAIGSRIEIVRILQLAERRSSPHLVYTLYEILPKNGESLE